MIIYFAIVFSFNVMITHNWFPHCEIALCIVSDLAESYESLTHSINPKQCFSDEVKMTIAKIPWKLNSGQLMLCLRIIAL